MAMATVLAVNENCSLLILRILELPHACILPRVLNVVDKYNVRRVDVQTSVHVDVMLSVRFTEGSVEDFLAIRHPIVMTYSPRSHWSLIVWNLEPAELGTILPGPLPASLIDIIGDVL